MLADIALTDRAASPQDWAMTQTNLANALAATGARERAVACYRAALEAFVGPDAEGYRAVVRFNLALAERR